MKFNYGSFVSDLYYHADTSLKNEAVTTAPLVTIGYGKQIQSSSDNFEHVERPNGLQLYQLLYIKRGKIKIQLDGKDEIYGENTLFLQKPGVPHRYYGYDCAEKHSMYILFSGSAPELYLDRYQINQSVFRFKAPFTAFEDIINRMDAGRMSRHRQDLSDALLLQLFILIADATERPPEQKNGFDELIQFMISTCHLNYPIKLYADFIHFSEIYFVRFFKKAMGMPPHKYLIELRLRKAAHLLIYSNTPIKDVAAQCGYSNPHYFSNAFMQRYKRTPSEYRATGKEDKTIHKDIDPELGNFYFPEEQNMK